MSQFYYQFRSLKPITTLYDRLYPAEEDEKKVNKKKNR